MGDYYSNATKSLWPQIKLYIGDLEKRDEEIKELKRKLDVEIDKNNSYELKLYRKRIKIDDYRRMTNEVCESIEESEDNDIIICMIHALEDDKRDNSEFDTFKQTMRMK